MGDYAQHILLKSHARTNVGQVRDNNEDNIHLWARDAYTLAVVADGMGGAAAGEEASRLAVEAIEAGLVRPEYTRREALTSMTDGFIVDKMSDAVRAGNLRIIERAATHPEFRGMGTTVTLAFLRGTHAIVAHVGDSRAYYIDARNRHILQVTSDHSFVEALVAAGHLTPEQADEHPMKNVLYRALGQSEDVEVDIYEFTLSIGDRVVMCSDGLTRHVKPDEILSLTLTHFDPEAATQALVDLANKRGGEDNVSVIVIRVESNLPESVTDDSTVELRPLSLQEDTIRLRKSDEIKSVPASETEDTLRPNAGNPLGSTPQTEA
jgi:PPM family protein phosphatase